MVKNTVIQYYIYSYTYLICKYKKLYFRETIVTCFWYVTWYLLPIFNTIFKKKINILYCIIWYCPKIYSFLVSLVTCYSVMTCNVYTNIAFSDKSVSFLLKIMLSKTIKSNVSTSLILNWRHHKLQSPRPPSSDKDLLSLQKGTCVAIEHSPGWLLSALEARFHETNCHSRVGESDR